MSKSTSLATRILRGLVIGVVAAVMTLGIGEVFPPVLDLMRQVSVAVLDPFANSYPGFVATGDLVTLAADPCACGLSGQSLQGEIRRAPGAAERGCGIVSSAE